MLSRDVHQHIKIRNHRSNDDALLEKVWSGLKPGKSFINIHHEYESKILEKMTLRKNLNCLTWDSIFDIHVHNQILCEPIYYMDYKISDEAEFP